MDHQQVWPLALLPVGALEIEERVGRRDAVAFVVRHPGTEEFPRVLRCGRRRFARAAVLLVDLGDTRDRLGREVQKVIVEREAGIKTAASRVDVFHLVVDRQRVERQVRFHGAAMGLRLEHRDHHIDRNLVAAIEPGRDLHDRLRLGRLKYQEADDALRPGRSDLRRRRHDDIAGAGRVALPVAAIPDAVFDMALCGA